MEPSSDHAIGRSRGGLTTKAYALTDGRGRALVVLLTAGNVNGTTMFAPAPAEFRVDAAGPAGLRGRRQGYSSRADAAVSPMWAPTMTRWVPASPRALSVRRNAVKRAVLEVPDS